MKWHLNKQGTTLLIIVTLIALITIGVLISSFIASIGKTAMVLWIAPEGATITVNGEEYSPGRHFFPPGEYEIIGSFESFTDDVQSITLGEEPVDIYLVPNPESDEAIEWFIDNPDAQVEQEAIGPLRSQQLYAEQEADSPLIDELPFRANNWGFRLEYGLSPTREGDDKIAIRVLADTPFGRDAALDMINKLGYDPSYYEIVFVGFENPITREDF